LTGSLKTSFDPSEVSVIIPVLNEEKAIGVVIDELIQVGIPLENIVVVDGGSKDKTVEIARSKGVKVVMQEGKGKALAVKTGLQYVSTPIVVVMDGDGTYPASAIPLLYSELKRRSSSLVIGARLFGKESQRLIFRIGNKLLTLAFNTLYGTNLKDILSGMYMGLTDKMREVNYEMKGFSVEVEIASHFANLCDVCEVPIEYRPRIDPKAKKLGVIHGFKIAVDMIRLTWRYNPTFLIFTLGSLLLIPGLILGIWVAYRYYFMGVVHHIKGLAALILVGAGFQSLISAIMALYVKRLERRVYMKIDEIKTLVNSTR